MSAYRPGQVLRLTKDGRTATIWSAAHLPATYWCHVQGIEGVALVQVRKVKHLPVPEVTLLDES